MNCKEAEKYIYLFKSDELTNAEKELLNLHLESCADCQQKKRELENYMNSLSGLKQVNPKSTDGQDFTNAILKEIRAEEHHKVLFIQHPLFRIAAVLLIALNIFPLFNQNIRISKSVYAMETKFKSQQEKTFFYAYNDCVSQSELMVAKFAKTDEEVASLLARTAMHRLPSEIERYAGKICQNTFDIDQLGTDEKKELILQILRSKRNL